QTPLAAAEIERRRALAGANEAAHRQLLPLAIAEMNLDLAEVHRIARDAKAQRAEAPFALQIERVAIHLEADQAHAEPVPAAADRAGPRSRPYRRVQAVHRDDGAAAEIGHRVVDEVHAIDAARLAAEIEIRAARARTHERVDRKLLALAVGEHDLDF